MHPLITTTTSALALLGNLFAQLAMVLDSLAGAEVVQLEQLPDLDFAILVMGVGAALDPLDRFRKRLTFQDPVARYQFLGLREWAVYHVALVAGEPHSSALEAWLQPIAIEHHAGFHHLLVELRHGRKQLLRGHFAGFGVLGCLNYHHEAHRRFYSSVRFGAGSLLALLCLSNQRLQNRQIRDIFFLSCRPSHYQ